MANFSSSGKCSNEFLRLSLGIAKRVRGVAFRKWAILGGLVLCAYAGFAQGSPQVTAVDPSAGKVNDTITISGEDLGKTAVSGVYLSDDKNDYKATILDQSDAKISMKVPQVKAGGYNISIQVGDKLFIKPVRFTVQE